MTRLTRAWRASGREQRLAALTALGLFVSMLFPWYSKTNTVVVRDSVRATQQSLSAFQAFSFVEAAVLLVSAGVLALLFARAERRDFQLPGGDGAIVMVAGGWAALLIFYRLLDKPGLQGNQRITATVGVEWGIFIALLLALGLLYAGARMRASEHAHSPPERDGERHSEPDPGEQQTVRRPRIADRADDPARASASKRDDRDDRGERDDREDREDQEEVATISPAPALGSSSEPRRAAPASGRGAARRRPRYPPAPSDQMSFEDQPPRGE